MRGSANPKEIDVPGGQELLDVEERFAALNYLFELVGCALLMRRFYLARIPCDRPGPLKYLHIPHVFRTSLS